MTEIDVTVESNVPTTMRDGTVLRADVYRPVGAEPQPVIVQRTPYDKASGEEVARRLAARGYVVVVQDIRGRYESDGEWLWQFLPQAEVLDGPDGYDTVEWAARLAGSDGRVGTWGHSYPSWCIWTMAKTAPPSLRAIFAGGMSVRHTQMNFGVFETARRLQWCYNMTPAARRRAGEAPELQPRAAADDLWHELERGKWI